MTKLKQERWHDRPRIQRLAMTLYPNLAPPEVQKEMISLAGLEGKHKQLEKRIKDGTEQVHNPWGLKKRR